MEAVGQTHVEHRQRRGNAEYAVVQGIKPGLWIHDVSIHDVSPCSGSHPLSRI
jgi:hypothetical protein